jgi:hypothetical protein
LLLLAFTAFAPRPGAGPVERDFEAYYGAGATVDAGGDPYTRAIWAAQRRIPGVDAARDEVLPFVGPAASLPLWAALARLPYRAAVVVWTILLAAAALLIVFAAVAIGRPARDPWRYAILAATAGASAPLASGVALGQAAVIGAAGIAAALVAYRARRGSAAVGATLAAVFAPNLAVALIARIRSRWDAAAAGAAALVFALLTLAFGGGLPGWWSYLARLRAHGRAERDIAIQHTPAAVAYALGLSPHAAAIVGGSVAGVAVAAAIVAIVGARLGATTATLLACSLLPLAMPFFHEHDFAVAVLPLLVLALRARGPARGLAAAAATLVLVDWFGLAQRPAASAQILCLGLAVVVGFAGSAPLRSRSRGSDLPGIVTLLVLATVAVPFAHAHPAPSWPEMLPAHFAADPSWDESAVWGAEQRAAGLAKQDPVWGWLRALPLTGSALTGAALVVDARERRRRRQRRRPLDDRARRAAAVTARA